MLNLGVRVKNFIMQLFKIIQKCIHTRTNIRLPTARLKNQLYQDSLYNSYNDFQCFNILNNWYHIMNSPVTWFPLHQQCFWGCPFHYCVMSHCMNLPQFILKSPNLQYCQHCCHDLSFVTVTYDQNYSSVLFVLWNVCKYWVFGFFSKTHTFLLFLFDH